MFDIATDTLLAELSGLPKKTKLHMLVTCTAFLALLLDDSDESVRHPRIKELLGDADEDLKRLAGLTIDSISEKTADGLIYASDSLGQTWPEYSECPLPNLFHLVATRYGVDSKIEDFADTSYGTWYRALQLLSDGGIPGVENLLLKSLTRYKEYGYTGDAAWLYTDLTLFYLICNDSDKAREAIQAQRQYVEGESRTRRPSTELWRDSLAKYCVASEAFLRFFSSKNSSDFKAAIDAFSYDWSTYGETYYIAIFNLFRKQILPDAPPGFFLDAHETLFSIWSASMKLFFVSPNPERLHVCLSEVRTRLRTLNDSNLWAICLLDEVLLHYALQGGAAAFSSLGADIEPCSHIAPELTDHLVQMKLARTIEERMDAVRKYIAGRVRYGAPELVSVYSGIEDSIRGASSHMSGRSRPVPVRPQLDISLIGKEFYINGILVWQNCPTVVTELLTILGDLFQGQHSESSDSSISAEALGARLGKSPGALAQVVRRIRSRVETAIGPQLGHSIGDLGRIIEGRGGYRLSEDLVLGFRVLAKVRAVREEQERDNPLRIESERSLKRLRVVSSRS